jgi:hypothetical protein
MKSKDIAIIVGIAGFAAILAFIISNMFLAAPENLKSKIEVVEPISTTFDIPGETYFNSNSVNPTQLIRIGENQNQNPFQ